MSFLSLEAKASLKRCSPTLLQNESVSISFPNWAYSIFRNLKIILICARLLLRVE